jgi:hypothetical protein
MVAMSALSVFEMGAKAKPYWEQEYRGSDGLKPNRRRVTRGRSFTTVWFAARNGVSIIQSSRLSMKRTT